MVEHVYAHRETSYGGPHLLGVGLPNVYKGACECGMLEDAGGEPLGLGENLRRDA
jgi:hypothetical protein